MPNKTPVIYIPFAALPLIHDDSLRLHHLMGLYQGEKAEAEAHEEKRKSLSDEIQVLLAENNIGSFEWDGNRVSHYTSQRPTIDRIALLTYGVTPEIIDACTKPGKPFLVLRISPPKESGS